MKKLIVFLFTILVLHSCLPTPATKQQKEDAMKSAYFDKNIIKNIGKYENLKIFLEDNIDTIIKFRYSKNTATIVKGQGQPDSNYLSDENCYIFFQGNSRYDITNVPDILKNELDCLFNSLSESEIRSFEVCKDKKISIDVRREGGDNGLYIYHNLIWNTKMERDHEYEDNKDTLINGNCIYRIGMSEHHGH